MKLTLEKFHKFSQGENIKADIKGGWCAGVTGLVSEGIGSYSLEDGYDSAEQWLTQNAFERAKGILDRINDRTQITQTLQSYLGRVSNERDVTHEIHLDKFDGRTCKVLMSVAGWIPVLSTPINFTLAVGDYIFKTKYSKWHTNHVGVIVRGGTRLMLLEPNYGLGLFKINDTAALTLANITTAIATLAWQHSYSSYYGSCSMAIATLDESGLRGRVELDLLERAQALSEAAKYFV